MYQRVMQEASGLSRHKNGWTVQKTQWMQRYIFREMEEVPCGKQDEEGEKEWEESITFQVKKGL